MHKTFLIVGLACGLAASAVQAGPPLARDDALKLMGRPGSWIEVDGSLLPDGTFSAKEVEIYAPGDTASIEESAIYGPVQNLNRAKSTMRVLNYTILYDSQTTLKDENKRQILSSKIQNEMGVKVQGSVQPNNTFKATKIKLQKVRLKDGKPKPKESLFGPVSIVDARAGLLRILNTSVQLREDATIIEAVPDVGSR